MKNKMKTENLPIRVLLLGAAAAVLRSLLYLTAVDEKGLLERSHPVTWLLWLVCAGTTGYVLADAGKRKGSNRYSDNFAPGTGAAIGCFVLAAGVVLTLISGNSMQRALLVRMWMICGMLAAAGLVWAGCDRRLGKRPNLLAHAPLCLFLALHMVSRYQPWSGNPQVQDWVFSLLAAVGLTLCAYHHSAFCAGVGHRRLLLATALLTVFACCAALPYTEYFALYLCGGVWAYTGICRVMPVPQEKTTSEKE